MNCGISYEGILRNNGKGIRDGNQGNMNGIRRSNKRGTNC